MIDPTAEQVAAAGEVVRYTTLVHRRTAIRPANTKEAQAIAIAWARIFARYGLERATLLEAVDERAASNPVAPEPAEIVAVAREIRRRSAECETREEREARDERNDRKILERINATSFGRLPQ